MALILSLSNNNLNNLYNVYIFRRRDRQDSLGKSFQPTGATVRINALLFVPYRERAGEGIEGLSYDQAVEGE